MTDQYNDEKHHVRPPDRTPPDSDQRFVGTLFKASEKQTAKHHVRPPGVSYPYGERGEVYLPEERRNEGLRSKNERNILAKELRMARVFAKAGYKIVFNETGTGTHDVFIDGIAADLKKLKNHTQVAKRAKKAVNLQGAEWVLFEFEQETKEVYAEIERLKIRNIHGKYFFSGSGIVYNF